MNESQMHILKVLSAGLLLSATAMPAPLQTASAISADIGTVPLDVIHMPRIDPSLAADTVQNRTLVRIWQTDGDLAAMRRIIGDPAKRSHAVGHFAEDDFVVGDPTWRKTAASNAPENDVWRWRGGRLEGGQIKTHASGDPAEYIRDMLVDTKAERFIVPDDHAPALQQELRRRILRSTALGNETEAAAWQRELDRVTPLGRTYPELQDALISSANRVVRMHALKGAGGMAALSLAVDGSIICYRCANGELTPVQVQEMTAEAIAKASTVAVATYVVVIAGANPAGLTVIVVGGVVYIAADFAIDEIRSSYWTSPMTSAEIDQVMPIGWHRIDP